MMVIPLRRYATISVLVSLTAVATGCDWKGLNSIPLPGTAGGGRGAYVVQAQLPDVTNIQQNSRVRVGDVTVGNVTKVERQGWHALITMSIDGDVDLPANAAAKVGQTSLLGSQHVELGPPADAAPQGRLHDGSLIPLSSGATYPTSEETLAAMSLLLNGGGIGQVQEITRELRTAFTGRESDVRSLIDQLDRFVSNVDEQSGEIIAAAESLNALTGQFADQKPVVDEALRTVPQALDVLRQQRDVLVGALDRMGQFSAETTDVVNQTSESLTQEINDLGPVLESLANAGPALTRSLSLLATFPWPKETISKWMRGDYANMTLVLDMTLSRLDSSIFTGTRWEGDLTQLELQWGRTIGQMPSPYTLGNPLTVPYQLNQGP